MTKEKKTKRKAVSKKIRFEVFKRDSFKCQYCGAEAPDVVLHIDHIKPVSKRGTNAILNLITACEACNTGKGPLSLDDKSVVKKARTQIESLQERREQLEMMMQWKDGLQDLKGEAATKALEYWHGLAAGWLGTDHHIQLLRKWLNTYSICEILKAMETAAGYYLKTNRQGKVTCNSWGIAFDKISGICRVTRLQDEKPYLRSMYYIRAILRNREIIDERFVIPMLDRAFQCNVNPAWLKDIALRAYSWKSFESTVWEFIIECESEDE